jgi:hypothetical protein
MSATLPPIRSVQSRRQAGVASERPWVRRMLTATALAFVATFLLVPLALPSRRSPKVSYLPAPSSTMKRFPPFASRSSSRPSWFH